MRYGCKPCRNQVHRKLDLLNKVRGYRVFLLLHLKYAATRVFQCVSGVRVCVIDNS